MVRVQMGKAYFDYQSSTPVLPEVLAAMEPYWQETFGTPSSLHQQGLRTRDALDQARGQVAELIGAGSPEEILFTSGGTEAINLAVQGVAFASRRQGDHLVVSATEHPAVMRSVDFLEKEGFKVTRLAVDTEGLVDAGQLKAAVTEKTILIAVHHANHDIGTIEPIAEMGAVAAERGIPFFVDATASGGWLPIDVAAWGASLVALSPHRFYGPKGVGILYRHRRARLRPMIYGGMQEMEYRAGTENVPGIVGAGVAAELAARDQEKRHRHTQALQQELWEGLQQAVTDVHLNGPKPGPGRLSTNLNISVARVEGEGLALMADVQGIALASGASCISKSLKVSPVLQAIGLDRALAQSNIILSLGQESQREEVTYFLQTFPGIVARLREMSPL